MEKKVGSLEILCIIYMVIMLVVSFWIGGLFFNLDKTIGVWVPGIIAVVWIICPFVLKIWNLDGYILFLSILLAIIYGISSFDYASMSGFILAFFGFIASIIYSNFVYELVDDFRNKRKDKMIRIVAERLQRKIDIYKEMSDILNNAEEHRQMDNIIDLLDLCSAQGITSLYQEKYNKKNNEILRQVEKILNQNGLKLNIQDRTISQLKREIDENIEALQDEIKQVELSSIYEIKRYAD